MAQKSTTKKNTQTKATPKNSWGEVLQRLNNIIGAYSNLPMDSIYSAFGKAWANMAPLQNERVKAIGTLPADYDKQDLGEFLRFPQNSEKPLRQIAEGLKWSVYSFYKLQKSYADILTFRHYSIPEYITAEEIKSDTFKREFKLIDKLNKAIGVESFGHKVAGEALVNGKVFFVPRYRVDKSHNKVEFAFMQRLPQNWVLIEGFNNVSGYTISFNLMYFLQLGTDYTQFGDLFTPYLDDFNAIFEKEPKNKNSKKYIFASEDDNAFSYKANSREFTIYPNHINRNGEGNPRMFMQNGRWCYWVSLPVDKVWTFEVDDSTPLVASPFSGLMQTFAQQADYEAAQLSLVLNPLIKIFTGEIPYYQSTGAKEDDGFRLSLGARALFEAYWQQLMNASNTGGTTFFTAPVSNIHAWDYGEASNANSVSQSFLNYGMAKTGTQGIIPVTDRPTQGVAEVSAKLEARYPQCIYRTMERMVNSIYDSLNLNYDWHFHIFGDIYSENEIRSNALKQIDKGDLSAYFILSALDDESVLDKVTMCQVVKASGLTELLEPPQTAYTQSGSSAPKSDTGGAPTKTESDVRDTKIEKQTESAVSE